MQPRRDVVGKSLFEVFPDNPDEVLADGVSNLYSSLRTVAQTGQPHAMAIQRYDISNPVGEFVERHWQPINRRAFNFLATSCGRHDRSGAVISVSKAGWVRSSLSTDITSDAFEAAGRRGE